MVELGAEPGSVDEVRVVLEVEWGGLGRRGGGRQRREERGEEGVEREEGFKGVRRRGGRGHVGEEGRQVVDVSSRGEELLAKGFQV